MNDEVKNKMIDDYLRGRMTKEALIDFKKRLFTDHDLAAEVEISKNLYALYNCEEWEDITHLNEDGVAYQEYLLSDDAQEIHAAIIEAQNNYKRVSITPRKQFNRWYAVAASLVLLIAFSYTFVQNSNNSTSNLYATYSDLSDLPSLTLRSDADKLLSDAEQLFNKEEYQGALRSLELYEEKYQKNNPNAILYKGICFMELNKFEDAKQTFNTLKNSNALDKNKAYWYLALTSLKQKDVVTAKNLLSSIVENSYHNHSKASQLLLDLD